MGSGKLESASDVKMKKLKVLLT